MPIFIVRLGSPRKRGEGLRLGTVRRPPRGVAKSDFARLDYYDVWFPNLSPSAELVREALRAKDKKAWSPITPIWRSAAIAKTRAVVTGRSCANSSPPGAPTWFERRSAG